MWVRPMGQPMMNPADPVFRLPRSSQLVGLAAVTGEPGPYVRLRAQIGDIMALAFARSIHLGKSDLPADQNAATNGTRFENRTIDLVIDPVDGHLVETAAQLDLAVDLNLVSDWGSPITGDQVIKVTSSSSRRGSARSRPIRRPTSAITLATSRQNEDHDAMAQSLLGTASGAMLSAYLEYKTYRVSLNELSKLAPRVKWVTRKAAQAVAHRSKSSGPTTRGTSSRSGVPAASCSHPRGVATLPSPVTAARSKAAAVTPGGRPPSVRG